jgi:hypothetical protein
MSISNLFIVHFRKPYGVADSEANTEFEISSDTQFEDNDSSSEIENSESCRLRHSDCTFTLSKFADRVETQSFARVRGNGK